MAHSSEKKLNNWIKVEETVHDCEKIEAFFSGQAYEPHRHDTYAIGRTLSGVQRFHYRGSIQDGTSGTAMIIHPDELHDGQAGTYHGFHYRMMYLRPELIQDVLKGQSLPFIQNAISTDVALLNAIDALLSLDGSLKETLEWDDALYDFSYALFFAAGHKAKRKTIDYRSTLQAKDFIQSSLEQTISLSELEHITGRDKWSLSRDFRLVFGTSPYRYLTLRRLDKAKKAIISGESLATTAALAGFADQAHFTRHFRNAFGMTPALWRKFTSR